MNPVREAWFEAALDLRIRIQEPNPLEDVADDPARVVYVPDFGGTRGAVVFAQDFTASHLEKFDTKPLKAAGYFYSIVSLQGYSHYRREHFVETLLDWGYFGPTDECPHWYTVEVSKLAKKSEPAASPNGGLAERLGNSRVSGGPPSVT